MTLIEAKDILRKHKDYGHFASRPDYEWTRYEGKWALHWFDATLYVHDNNNIEQVEYYVPSIGCY